MMACDKYLKEYSGQLKFKKQSIEDAEAIIEDRKIDLDAKRKELDSIEEETATDIDTLTKQADEAKVKIDDRLLTAYARIRGNVHNGLAVVTVMRDACGGCYNRIPPQRQAEIRLSKKIIICEYCGRILVSDPELESKRLEALEAEATAPAKKRTTRTTKAKKSTKSEE